MKKTLLFIAVLLGLAGTAKADVEDLWSGTLQTNNYANSLEALSWGQKGNLGNAMMKDQIIVTYNATGADAQIQLGNPNNGWNLFDANAEQTGISVADNLTFTYTISSASVLEDIQKSGIIVKGKNITITKVQLSKPEDRYDAVPVIIGEDGIITWSSSKHLDFSGIDGLTTYYASEVSSGTVTLTQVTGTYNYVGYIVKGPAGTYDVPVATTAPDYVSSYLVASNDGEVKVFKSAFTDYVFTDGDFWYSDEDNKTAQSDRIKSKYRYIFAKNASGNIGFYKLATNYERTVETNTYYYHVLAAHKAYLETADDIAPTSAPLMMIFDGDGNDGTTFIEQIGGNVINDNKYYDLSGRYVAQPTKGLYIVNGKKVFIK